MQPCGNGPSLAPPPGSAAPPAFNPGPCIPPCPRSSRTCTRILLCPASGVLPPHPRHSCLSSGGRLMIVPSCTYTPVKRLSNSGALASLVSTSPTASCNSSRSNQARLHAEALLDGLATHRHAQTRCHVP